MRQRGAKLCFVKLWERLRCLGLKPGPQTHSSNGWSSRRFIRPSTLTESNFAILCPTETICTSSKRSKFLKDIQLLYKTSCVFRIGFVLLTLLIPTFFSYAKPQGEVKFHLPLTESLIVSQLINTMFKMSSKSKILSFTMLIISKRSKILLKKLEKLRWTIQIPSLLKGFF